MASSSSAFSSKKERQRRSMRSSSQNTTNEHMEPPFRSCKATLQDSNNNDSKPIPYGSKKGSDRPIKLTVSPYKRTSYLPKPPTCPEKRRSWRRSVYKSLEHFASQGGSDLPDDLNSSSSSITLATCSLTDASSQRPSPSTTREGGNSPNQKNAAITQGTPPTYCLRIKKKRNNKASIHSTVFSPPTPDITVLSPLSEDSGRKSRLSSLEGMAKIPSLNGDECNKGIDHSTALDTKVEVCNQSPRSPMKRRSILKKKKPGDHTTSASSLSSSMDSLSSSNHSARFSMEAVTIKEVPRLETEGDLSHLFYDEDEIAQFRHDAWVEVMGLESGEWREE